MITIHVGLKIYLAGIHLFKKHIFIKQAIKQGLCMVTGFDKTYFRKETFCLFLTS